MTVLRKRNESVVPSRRRPALAFQAARGDAAKASESVTSALIARQGQPLQPEERVLATFLFGDIVDSTRHATALGDRSWRDVLALFHMLVRAELPRFRGSEVDAPGDGFLAVFDGPSRAIRCAAHIVGAVHALGLDIRIGLHAGECEASGGGLAGIAIHISARVAGVAQPGEVVVSSTVRDLVMGSRLRFADRGVHTLRGVAEPWHLFTVNQPWAWL